MRAIPIADLSEYRDGAAVPAVEGVLTKLFDPNRGESAQYGAWVLQNGILTDDNQNEISICFAADSVIQPKEMWNKRIHIEPSVGQKGSNGLKMKKNKKTGELGLHVTGTANITYPDGKPAPRQEREAPAEGGAKPVSRPSDASQPHRSIPTPKDVSTVSERAASYFKIFEEVGVAYENGGEHVPELSPGDLKDIATTIFLTYKGDYGVYAPAVFDKAAPSTEVVDGKAEVVQPEEAEPEFDWKTVCHPSYPDLPMGQAPEQKLKAWAGWALGLSEEVLAGSVPAVRLFAAASLRMAAEKKWGPAYLVGNLVTENKIDASAFDAWCQKNFGVTSDEINQENCTFILGNQKKFLAEAVEMADSAPGLPA